MSTIEERRTTAYGRPLPARREGDLAKAIGAAPSLVPASDVQVLNDDERQAILAWLATHPDGGYKAALHSVGISATRAEARKLLHSDDEIRDARFKAMGLDEGSLFKNMGVIAGNVEHKDCLRANTWVLNAVHKWAETRATEHTGPDGGPMEVADSHVADALDRFTEQVRKLSERAESDRAVRDDAGGRAALAPGEVRD